MFEKILRFFIENSKLNYLLFFLVFAVGIVSYNKTPKEIFPTFDLDMVVVNGSYTGASIDTLNKIIVNDLEDDIKSVQGIDTIDTIIKPNSFSIVLELKKGTNRYNVASQVKDIVSTYKQNLPSDMDEPIVKTLELVKPLLQISILSEQNDINILNKKADILKSKLFNIPNISDIKIYGSSDIFYDVKLDNKKIEAYGLSVNSVVNTLQTISYTFPIGQIEGKEHFYISTYNGAKTEYELKNSKLYINGVVLYLKDIATIKKRYEDSSTLSSIDGKRAITLVVSQSATGDAMRLTKQIEKLLEKENLKDKNIQYIIMDDMSAKIKDRLNIVISNILLGLIIITLLVALLINSRMAFVIMIGIPTSFVIAAVYFYLSGYTINMISLVGVLLALGIIVDDAMVVSEQIQQYVEEGYSPKEAAIKGSVEMVKPVTIASITTMFAFLPSLMISGTMGEVIKLIPIALSALIVASLIESFIFLPIHAAHTLKSDAKVLSWDRANQIYSAIIHFFMRWKKSFLVVFIFGVPVFTFILLKQSHFQMFPEFDSTTINITLKAQKNVEVEESFEIVNSIAKKILENKEKFYIKNISATAGFRKDSGGNSETLPYAMNITVELTKLKAQNFLDKYITPNLSFYYDTKGRTRELSSQDISKKLIKFLKEQKFKEKYNLVDLSVVQKKVGPIKADIKIGLVSNSVDKINKYIKLLSDRLHSIDGVLSVANSVELGVDELKLKVNSYGESLGVDEGYIGAILSDNYLDKKVSTIFDKDGIVDLKIESIYKDDYDNFLNQIITLKDGINVRLKDICEVKVQKSFEKLIKENGKTNFYIFSNVDTKIVTASEALAKLKPLLEQIEKDGVEVILKGEAQKNKELKNDMMLATSLAMVLIFISILYLFNSFRETFIVMSVIPYSLLGVILGHIVMDVNLGMTSMIGALGLAGVVINDGIIMLTTLKKARTVQEVFYFAAKRFRPIILTSVTTLIGVASLIFFPTGQAVIFQPMAIALGFGLAWGTVLNLIYVPVLYTFANRLR